MRKLLPLLSAIFLVAFAIVLVNCGNDHHAITPSNQFAFIREAAGGLSISAAHHAREIRGVPRLLQHRLVQRGAGLRPWAVEIDPGTDSVIIMNNDGTGETVAVNQGGWFYNIQAGLTGQKVAFTAEMTGTNGTHTQVLVASGSGTNYENYTVTQLTNDAEDHYQAQLSADGTKVVFVKEVNGSKAPQAFIVSASGGAETPIPTADTVDVWSPTFTPDGKSIVFEDCEPDTINIVNLDGTGMKVLDSTFEIEDDTPAVSPDGKTIAFLRDYDVYTMDMNGQNLKQLTTDGWSDDPMFVNNKIVFVSWRDGVGPEIYSMNIDGTNQKRLTNNAVWDIFDYYDVNQYD